MNGVIGMTELLLNTPLTPQQREYAELIRTSGESLLTVINDILDFSKIEAQKLTLEALDFDLQEVVETTLELLAERAQAKRIELASLVAHDVPRQLRGDPGRLRQVLTNLVGNAIKFTEQGEVVVRVVVFDESARHVTLWCEVKDTGIGIPVEAQARLFQAFSQGDGSTSRKYGGTGLGLVISRRLVELMGGQIGVKSTPDQGSTFWFTVLLEKQAGGAAPTVEPKRDLVGLRVLIVDDNATNRLILGHQMHAWKMRSVSAANGTEALQVLGSARDDPFDLVILDMQMPDMDGLALARAIKAAPGMARPRLVILTSLGQPLDGAELQAAGVEAYLAKPVRQSRLFDCLATAMGRPLPEDVGPGQSPAPPTRPPHALRILLAEDNVINQRVTVGQLRRLGYTAEVVANGQEVLEVLRRVPYDVILMDCQMPKMDGYEATREIRRREEREQRKPVQIIAMTASAMQGDREKCLEAGMNDYISKPVREVELAAVLRRCLPVGDRAAGAEPASTSPAGTSQAPSPAPAVADGAATAGISEEPPVDVEQLNEVLGSNPEQVHELTTFYLAQADELLRSLRAAIEAGVPAEVGHIAHKLVGSSATCGMRAVVSPLRELERLGSAGQLSGADQLAAQVCRGLESIRGFLVDYLRGLQAHSGDDRP
jgi:CheY-like chemotaxis protein